MRLSNAFCLTKFLRKKFCWSPLVWIRPERVLSETVSPIFVVSQKRGCWNKALSSGESINSFGFFDSIESR